MAVEIKIVRIKGFEINPDDKHVNKIFNQLGQNNGHCPTKIENRFGHDQCPCSEYLQKNQCYCKLYVKNYEH